MMDEVMMKWRMTINWGKTKVMVVKRGGGTCNITVNGVGIENVKTMKYLGGMLDEEGSCEAEVDHRNRCSIQSDWSYEKRDNRSKSTE